MSLKLSISLVLWSFFTRAQHTKTMVVLLISDWQSKMARMKAVIKYSH